MRLLCRFDLQSMLDQTQKAITAIQIENFFPRDDFKPRKRSQCAERTRLLEESVTASMDELQRLHHEFDFANATATELQIALHRVRPGDLAFNPALDGGDLVEQIRGRTPRINERLMLPQKLVSQFSTAGDCARFNQRDPFPSFAKARII